MLFISPPTPKICSNHRNHKNTKPIGIQGKKNKKNIYEPPTQAVHSYQTMSLNHNLTQKNKNKIIGVFNQVRIGD